jgi:hypothetical protein
VQHKATIYDLLTKLCFMGWVLDRRSFEKDVLAEEKLDGTGAWLEAQRNHNICWLFSMGWQGSMAHIGTKLLKLQYCKTAVLHSLLPPDCKTRIQYCRWIQKSVFSGLHGPELMFYSDEEWFSLSGYINSQNNRYWSTESHHAVHEVPLHDLKVGVWYAVSAWSIIGPMFFSRHHQF